LSLIFPPRPLVLPRCPLVFPPPPRPPVLPHCPLVLP
jgi:hypothetical protein